MYIKIYCTDISEAISRLENDLQDRELQEAIDTAEEGETIYTPWGEIET